MEQWFCSQYVFLLFTHSLRLAQLVKRLDLYSKDSRLEPHCWWGAFLIYGSLASLLFQIASMGPDHHDKIVDVINWVIPLAHHALPTDHWVIPHNALKIGSSRYPAMLWRLGHPAIPQCSIHWPLGHPPHCSGNWVIPLSHNSLAIGSSRYPRMLYPLAIWSSHYPTMLYPLAIRSSPTMLWRLG